MEFQFENLTDFLAMGGHGPYVWSAYGLGLIVLLALILNPLRKKKQLLKQYRINSQRASIKNDTPEKAEAS